MVWRSLRRRTARSAAFSSHDQMELIAELSGLLAAEHKPVSEEFLAEARAAWPEGD
jgi:hypothetical protein